MNRTYRHRCLRRRLANAALPWLSIGVAAAAIGSIATAVLT